MEDNQLRTMTGIYENRLRDYLAAKGEGWTVEECERNEDGYCIDCLLYTSDAADE